MAYFERTTVPNGGKPSRGFKIECGHCKFHGAIPLVGSLSAENEAKLIQSKFEAIGWKIGKGAAQHRCPRCFSAIKNSAITKSQKSKENQMPEKLAVEPAREMGREDKRLIFAKIHEVYGDNSYLENWTDAKVANDLGVQRAWVKTVREAEFGPDGGNEEIAKAIEEAIWLLKEVRALEPTVKRMLTDVQTLTSIADKVQKTVSEIERGIK